MVSLGASFVSDHSARLDCSCDVSPFVFVHCSQTETLSTAYAAEVCPLALRGYLTSFVNMAWGFGLFLAAGVVRASIVVDSEWGERTIIPALLDGFVNRAAC